MLGQQRLGLGAAQAGLEGRGHRDRVDGEQPLHPDQVEADHAGVALAPGDQAAGDRRAAAERARPRGGARPRRRARAATSSWPPGRTTASGASVRSPARARSRSGVDLPRVRSRRVSSSVSTCSAPSERAQAVEQRRRRCADAGQRRRLDGAGARRAPKTSSTRPRAASGSGGGAAGSPQRCGCISTAVCSGLMCYSVTHDVTSSQPIRDRSRAGPGRLPRRRPRLHPRRRLAADDADRGRAPGRGLPDDDLPRLARHAAAARRPDDPRVGRRRGGRAWPTEDPDATAVDRLVGDIVGTVRALRDNELFLRIVELDPELLLPYLLSRRGRSQDAILAMIAEADPGGPGRRRGPRRRPGRDRAGPAARRPRLRALGAHHGRRRRRPRTSSTPSSPTC